MSIYNQIGKKGKSLNVSLGTDYFHCSDVNLKLFPANLDLLDYTNFDDYIKFDFIPWRILNNKIHIVTSIHTPELLNYLNMKYGENYILLYADKKQIFKVLQRKFSSTLLHNTLNRLHNATPYFSAFNLIRLKHKFTVTVCILLCISFAYFYKSEAILIMLILGNALFFINSLNKMLLIIVGSLKPKISIPKIHQNFNDWPVYTILLPVYKEGKSIHSLVKAITNLDYPMSRLDIKLIIEQYDRQTISILKDLKLHSSFQIVCVPKSMPMTKPKACSYALHTAKGEFVVIYDAEDKPEKTQLKTAVEFFRNNPNVACVQARLNFFNKDENSLAYWFSVEYSTLFDHLLKGLERLDIPLPLGGSSNHFRKSILNEINGWDPYNVTEDADIGYRVWLYGYKTKIINSYTLEEAPINLYEWINQRARWTKGHIQTFLVHFRNLKFSCKTIGIRRTLCFNVFLILPIFAYFFQFLILFLGHTYLFSDNFNKNHELLWNICFINICLWYSFSYLSVFLASYKNIELRWKAFLYPFYFLLHPIALIKALWQLFFSPYYWHKTTHNYYHRHKIKFRMPFLRKKAK